MTPVEQILPLTNEHFRIACRLRLALPQTHQPTKPTCQQKGLHTTCNKPTDSMLHHVLACPCGPGPIRRHDALRDAWQLIIADFIGFEPLAEQLLPHVPNTLTPSTRVTRNAEVRADLAIPTTTTLKYLDITVATPMKQEFLRFNAAATTPGIAAAHAEKAKHVHYEPYHVTPLAMETFGRWGEEALQFLRSLSHTHETWMSDTTKHTDSLPPTTTSVFQTLSTKVQRENARIIHTYTQRPEAYADATA